jgi:exodeoxyribonuclease VII small subunit
MSKKSKQNFSTAYNQLQEIASKFEKDEIDLESSIPQFKKAAELVKYLKKRLSEIENQIEEINLDTETDQDL